MRTQFPVTDTSTASTARATSTGCLFVSKQYKTYIDTAEILPSHRTQSMKSCFLARTLSFRFFKVQNKFSELWEILRFPQSAGSNTKVIIQYLKPLLDKDEDTHSEGTSESRDVRSLSKLLSYLARSHTCGELCAFVAPERGGNSRSHFNN